MGRTSQGDRRDKTLLYMIVTSGSPSKAWQILLSMIGESSEAAQDKVKKEFEEPTFEIGKTSIRDYVARVQTW